MKNLPVIIILSLAAMLTGWFLLQSLIWNDPSATSRVANPKEKQLIDEARKHKDIAALNVFIRSHPDSEWIDTATFYRDQLAYHKAMEKGDQSSLKRFLKDYPASQWAGFARDQLEQLQREEEARLARRKRKQLLKEKISSGKLRIDPIQETVIDNTELPTRALVEPPPARSSISARERIQRALSIYEKQRDDEAFSKRQKQQREQEKTRQQQECAQMRQQLAGFSKRFRWYRVNEQGEKVFLSEKEIKQKKRETKDYLSKNCR